MLATTTMLMPKNERARWTRVRDEYEERIIRTARAAGKLPIIDTTVRGYPVPQDVLRALDHASNPRVRESLFREANTLRRKAASLRSLASVMERDGKSKQRDSMLEKAAEHESRAAEIEAAL